MSKFSLDFDLPTLGRRDSRVKSQSPLRSHQPFEPDQMGSIFNQLMKKDKEIEMLRLENANLKETVREFEFLVVKASEEVKKKQAEVADMKLLIENFKNSSVDLSRVSDLQSQLIEARNHIKTLESQSNSQVIQVRVELQKERELNADLSSKLQELRSQLETITNDSKNSTDHLQKSYQNAVQKFSKLEQEAEASNKLIVDLQQQSLMKDQTIDNAHKIIKKFKDEHEEIKKENDSLKEKVHEYKAKCKTLKKNNISYQDQIKILDVKAKENEALRKEIEKTKAELQLFIKTTMESKHNKSDQFETLVSENQSFQKTIESLQSEISFLKSENSNLSFQLSDERMKSKEICSQLIDREDTIQKLQEQIREEIHRHRLEVDSRDQIYQKSAEFRNTVPAASPQRPSANFNHVVRLERPKEERTRSAPMKRAHLYRSTPLKTIPGYRSKSRSPEKHEEIYVEQHSSPYGREYQMTGTHHEESMNRNQAELQKLEKENLKKEYELKIGFLVEELDKSVDRENHLALKVENTVARAEIDVERMKIELEELNNRHERITNQLHSGDIQLQYAIVERRYREACAVIDEMSNLNYNLTTKVDKLTSELNEISSAYEAHTKTLIRENHHIEQASANLLQETRRVFDAFETNSNDFKLDTKRQYEKMKSLQIECEKLRSECRMIEEQVDNCVLGLSHTFGSPVKTLGTPEKSSPYSNKNPKKSLSKKLISLIKNFENKANEIENERKHLLEKFTKLERETQSHKNMYQRMEKDYMESLREKEDMIIQKENLISQKEEAIRKHEEMISNRDEQFNELAMKEMNIVNVLNEKEEIIRCLSIEKDNLLRTIDDLNCEYNQVKKDLKQRMEELAQKQREIAEKNRQYAEKNREIVSRHDRLAELQKEIFNRAKEVDDLEKELNSRDIQLMEKDRKILQLQHENALLQEDLSALQTHYVSQRRGASPGFESGKKSLPQTKRQTDGSEERGRPQSILQPQVETPVKSPGFHSGTKGGFLSQERNDDLRKENAALLKKIEHLSQIIHNHRAPDTLSTYIRTQDDEPSFIKPVRKSSEAGLSFFDTNFVDQTIQTQDGVEIEQKETFRVQDNQQDKDLKEFIDKYKLKTKKMFQKRVKELELLLRYLDFRVKGYNFKKCGYTVTSQNQDSVSNQERNLLSRVNHLVEKMLDKNGNLKSFISNITNNIEKMHVRQHNLTLTLTRLFKGLFVNCIDNDNYSTLNQFGLLSQIEDLFQLSIPNHVESFEQIDTTLNSAQERHDLFSIFERIDPKLNFLHEYLISSLKQLRDLKIAFSSFKSQSREMLTTRKERLKDLDSLYYKLRHMIDNSKPTSAQAYSETMKNYIQVFHNIYTALFNESQEAFNFLYYNTTVTPEKGSHDLSGLSSMNAYQTNKKSQNLNISNLNAQTISPWNYQHNKSKNNVSLQNQSAINLSTKDESFNLMNISRKSPPRVERRPIYLSSQSGVRQSKEYGNEGQRLINDIVLQLDAIERGVPRKRSSSHENDRPIRQQRSTKKMNTQQQELKIYDAITQNVLLYVNF